MMIVKPWNHFSFSFFGRFALAGIMTALLIAFSASDASAQIRSGASNFCPHSGLFTERIIKCVRGALDESTVRYLHAFSDYMHLAIVLCVTLALVLVGFKIVMGDNQLKGKIFGLIFKIGLILWLTNDFGGLLDTVWGVMEDLQGIVTSTLMSDSSRCPVDVNNEMAVWRRLDCLMGRMFGFGPNAMLYNGLIGMVGAAMFSGAMGLQLFATGLSAMLMMMMMIFRAVYTFILAYTAIAFLVIMSPLIIPMMAFERTFGMFQKWLNQFLAAMVEPMILFAFLSFFFGTMETIIFDDFGRMSDSVANGYRSNVPLFSSNIMFDPQQWNKLIPKTEQGQALSNTVSPMFNGSTNLGDLFKVTKLDLGGDQESGFMKLIVSTISMIVTTYLMMSMIQAIPGLARGLVGLGESAATGTGMGLGRVPGQNKMEKGIELRANQASSNAEGGGGMEGLGSFFTGVRNMGRLGKG